MIKFLSFALLLTGLLQLPLYRGGNASWPLIILATSCGFSLLLASLDRDLTARRTDYIPAFLWLLWIGWITMQILPLPPQWLQKLSPAAFFIHQAAGRSGAEPLYTISLDPARSLSYLLLSITYAGLYFCAQQLLDSRRRIEALLISLLCIGVFESVFGALRLFGLVDHSWLSPVSAHSHLATGTFPNRNHFAAYLGLAAASCLSLLLWRAPAITAPNWYGKLRTALQTLSGPAVLLRVCLAGLLIGAVLSRSRMGNVAFAFGLTSFALSWLLTSRSLQTFSRASLLFLSIAIVDVALISQSYGLDRLLQRLETTNLEREQRALANQLSWQLVQTAPLTGSGLGTYRNHLESVRPAGMTRFFQHAHNDYLQFLIETGLVGVSILGALLIYHARLAYLAMRSSQRWKRACGAGSVMVACAGLLHASVEFNFQIPGYAATFIIWMSLLASPAMRRRPARHEISP